MLYEKAVWDFLRDNEVVKPYPYFKDKFENTDSEAVQLKKQLEELFKKERTEKKWPENPTVEQKAERKKEYFNHFSLHTAYPYD